MGPPAYVLQLSTVAPAGIGQDDRSSSPAALNGRSVGPAQPEGLEYLSMCYADCYSCASVQAGGGDSDSAVTTTATATCIPVIRFNRGRAPGLGLRI